MNKRSLIIVIILMLILNLFSYVYADFMTAKNIIVPFAENNANVETSLYCYNDEAQCYVDVSGNTNVTKIVVNMYLYKIDSDGIIANIASWTNITSNSNSLSALRKLSVTSGYTYMLKISATAYVGTKGETISKSVNYNY